MESVDFLRIMKLTVTYTVGQGATGVLLLALLLPHLPGLNIDGSVGLETLIDDAPPYAWMSVVAMVVEKELKHLAWLFLVNSCYIL